jgi:hypothetical protein
MQGDAKGELGSLVEPEAWAGGTAVARRISKRLEGRHSLKETLKQILNDWNL